jgi:predicted metal-dependent TIM-barrel fold hydrolase
MQQPQKSGNKDYVDVTKAHRTSACHINADGSSGYWAASPCMLPRTVVPQKKYALARTRMSLCCPLTV